MSKLIIILICLLVSLNAHAEPVGLSCYYDTGVTEINGTPTDDEYENKTFGMILDTELEWFWRYPPEAVVDETVEEWKKEKIIYIENQIKNYMFQLTSL